MNSRSLLPIFLLVLIISACNPEAGQNPADKINELRAQRGAIDAEIRELESKLDPTDKVNTAQAVDVMITELATFSHVIDVKGVVDSRSTVQVASQTGGRIVRVNVVNGQSVAKGQVLFEVDAEIIRRGIEEVSVQLDFGRTLLEKQKRIYEQKAGSEIQYLTSKNQVESLEKRLESLKEQLSLTRITAPTSGFADNVVCKVGETALPGMPMVTIVNNSDMRVVVDLAESFISTVSTGDQVKVMFTEIGDSMMTTINVVAKSVNPLSRTFRVEVPVRRVPANLRPNTTCRVLITDQTIPATISVPLSAVLHDASGAYVFVSVNAGIARRKSVETGLSSGGQIEIKNGLVAGEQVITRGATDIADGQQIRIVN